jgi:flavin-binding protein dodecin
MILAPRPTRRFRIAEVAELDLQINGGKVEAYRAKVIPGQSQSLV